MSDTTETANRVLIPGSYDILSPDHRLFIGSCLAAAGAEMDVEGADIGLVPDRALNRKGRYRPFYANTWRQDDIREWHATLDSAQQAPQLGFEEFYPGKLLHAPPDKPAYQLAVLSSEHEGSAVSQATSVLAQKTIFVPPFDTVHTTDIENMLRAERDASYCNWRVGAVLLRDGVIVEKYHNGGPESDSCASCPKQIDIQRVEAATGMRQPSPVPCGFSHAEARAATDAQPGDHLLTTLSPCQGCAEAIVTSGIERVVYLKPYHTTRKPISFLEDNGVQIRQAGFIPDAS